MFADDFYWNRYTSREHFPPERFSPAWLELMNFLRTDKLGKIARSALYQRSYVGRTRYLSEVLRISNRLYPIRDENRN